MAGLAVGAGLFVAAATGGTGSGNGVFRIAGVPDAIDPAISIGDPTDGLTCAQLMRFGDSPSSSGARVVPEVAAGYPTISRDGKTYVFTVRDTFRFSTGERVTAASFAHAITRLLNPTMKSPSVQSVLDIVGAQAVIDGKTTEISGVTARGNKLTIRLENPAGDFSARVSTFPFCAVPADLPVDPEGARAPLPGAGPYYVSEFVSGKKMVLARNPFYAGSRPHHVDGFNFAEYPDDIGAVKSGAADWVDAGPTDLVGLEQTYRSQLHTVPGLGLRMIVLNSARPLFRDNAPLRQAINFAIRRQALIRARGGPITGPPTDQYLMPAMPGYANAKLYPLNRPDLAKAKALANGNTRNGVATLYIKDTPVDIAQAQIIQDDLRPIGIRVTVRTFPGPALFEKLFTPGTPYDMTLFGWGSDFLDPYGILNLLFDGRLIGTPVSANLSHFDSSLYNGLLVTASRLTGPARSRAYGKLDVNLARNAAPVAVYQVENATTFVSKRVGCIVLGPYLDLAAVCLK